MSVGKGMCEMTDRSLPNDASVHLGHALASPTPLQEMGPALSVLFIEYLVGKIDPQKGTQLMPLILSLGQLKCTALKSAAQLNRIRFSGESY